MTETTPPEQTEAENQDSPSGAGAEAQLVGRSAVGQSPSPPLSRGAEGGTSTDLTQLQAALEESQARARVTNERLSETHDRLLRLAADFENFKKRAARERDETRKYGIENVLRDFLSVADGMRRALEHAASDPAALLEGVRLVQKQLNDALTKNGVRSFDSLGQPFDPARHEALMQQESDEPPNTVINEIARGYTLHDRLVRPAVVVVSKARAEEEPQAKA